MENKFLVKEVLGFGWNAMKKYFLFFLVLLIAAFLIVITNQVVSKSVENNILQTLVAVVIFFLINTVLNMVFIKASLQASNNEEPGSGDFFSFFRSYIDYLFASILYSLICAGGFLLLIIPGIIWSIQFSQFGYLIIDKGLNPIEALKKSSQITRGAKFALFKFYLWTILVIIAGALCLVIGLLAALPTVLVAWACVYRKLLAQEAAV